MKILSIKNINRSVFSTKKSTALASKSIENISNILKNKTSSRKKISDKIIKYKNRRLQSQLRQEQQDELYASSIVKSTGGPRLLSLSQVGGSFLNKIIKFIGYTAAGWILSNIPTWISAGKIFYSRMISLGSILKEFTFNVGKLISDIGFISNAFYKNIVNFDFFDTNYRIRNSLDDLNSTLDDMGEQIKEAFDIITEPFTNVTPLGSEGTPGAYPDYQPEEQEEQSQPPQSSQSSQPSLSGKNADFWTLVAIVSREDGDPQGQADVAQSIYNRAKSGAYGSSNIRELILRESQYEPTWQRPKEGQRGKPNPEWFQINDAKSAAKASGFSEGAIKSVAANITNPTLQKKAAEFVQGRTDFKGANSPFPGGIQRKSGDNYFGWQYGYKGKTIASIPNLGVSPGTSSSPSTAKPTPQKSQKPDISPTRTIKPIITSRYGEQRGKRSHGGTDLATSYGTPVTAVTDGKIIETGWEKGWGYFLVYQENKSGLYHLYAHMPKGSYKTSGTVKKGEVIGKVGTSGRSTGPHLHWEVGKSWNGIIGGKFDPLTVYSSGAPFDTSKDKSSSSTPLLPSSPTSEISQTTQVTNEVQIQSNELDSKTLSAILKYADIEKKQKIIFINDLQTTSPQAPTYSKDRGESLFGVTSQVEVLNTFIKHKFLLDLNYL